MEVKGLLIQLISRFSCLIIKDYSTFGNNRFSDNLTLIYADLNMATWQYPSYETIHYHTTYMGFIVRYLRWTQSFTLFLPILSNLTIILLSYKTTVQYESCILWYFHMFIYPYVYVCISKQLYLRYRLYSHNMMFTAYKRL